MLDFVLYRRKCKLDKLDGTMKSSKYNFFVHYEPDNIHIGYNAVSGGLFTFTDTQFKEAVTILNNPGQFNSDTPDQKAVKDEMIKGRFLIDENTDELKILKFRNNVTRYNTHNPGMVIAPELSCNFSCPYCYVDRKKVTMNPGIQSSVKKFFTKKIAKSSNATVCWTGGEPLLALNVIEDLNSYFSSQCREKDVDYKCSMVTNGYLLTPDVVKRLKKIGLIKLQITLDGCKDYHDKFRFTKDGGKTYEKILSNIVYATNNGLKITLRSNFNKDNIDGAYKLIDDLSESALDKNNFLFAPCMVMAMGGESNCNSCNNFTNMEFAGLEPTLLLYALKKGFKMSKSKLTTFRIYCGANSLPLSVIDAHANILKCWCNLGDSLKNKIGHINEAGDIHFTDLNLFTDWMSWDPFSIPECVDCKVLPVCMGGCMYHNIKGYTDKIDIGCTHLKHNLEKILKLYYLSVTKSAYQLECINSL